MLREFGVQTESAVRAAAMIVVAALVGFSFWVVYRSTQPADTNNRPIVLDFLWPPFTPQKARYGEYLKREYERIRPDVHVNLIPAPEPDYKLQVMIAGGTTPDVCWAGVGLMQFRDAFLPLDQFIAGDQELDPDTYYANLWTACQWRGSQRALPTSGQVAVIYYNKDLFDEAGLSYPTADWTWDDLLRITKALTRDFDGDGTIDQYGVDLSQVYVAPFLLYGGQIADPDWREARVDKPVVEAVLQAYSDLMYKHKVMPPAAVSREAGMLPMFEAGRVAVFASSGYAVESFRKVQFDWDIVTLPWFEFEGQRYRATGLWPEAFAVLWDTDIPEEAYKFARFCASRETIYWAATQGHIVPARKDVAHAPEYIQPKGRPQNMRAFIDSIEFAVPIYPHPWWRRIGTEFDHYIVPFTTGSDGIRLTPRQALEGMQTALQTILDEYNAEHEE